jgi:peptidoglycan hydrolase CwlO-like protein
MTRARRSRHRLATFAALLLAPLALWAVVPLGSGAAPTIDGVQSQIDAARSHEQSLSSDVAALSTLVSRLDAGVAVLERRQAEVQSELDARLRQLHGTQVSLAQERVRLAALRVRLARSKRVLARRLVEIYESGRPDALTVILSSHGFSDLLERTDFLRRINEQDARIVRGVRSARDGARVATVHLGRLESDQQRVAAAVTAQRNALASMAGALAAKRASAARARAARLEALRATRGNRAGLERELSRLQAEQAQSQSTAGPSGGWAIPWAVVQCESGGQNLPPNSAGASGYYQILPSTWRGAGGSGPAAYLASKAEQDRVAASLWDGGRGASNWVCAGLVRG